MIASDTTEAKVNVKMEAHNITLVMPEIFNYLSGKDIGPDTYAIDTIKKYTKSEDEAHS